MRTASALTLGIAFLLAAATARAAGDPAKPAAAPADAAGAAPGPVIPPPAKIDWEKMTVAQRKKYMKATVLPQMKKLFVGFDKKKYGSMSCATCHGDKASETKFKMPNPQLPKLPQPTDRAGFMALQQKKPEAAKFMGTQVKPMMASLLGLPEWSPTNANGFGCYGCHTKEGEAAGMKEPAGATPSPAAKAPAAPAAKAPPAAAPAPATPPPAGKGW